MTNKVLLISTRAADLHSMKSIRKMSEPSRRDGDWGFLGKLPLIEAKWRDGGERVDVLDALPAVEDTAPGARHGGVEEAVGGAAEQRSDLVFLLFRLCSARRSSLAGLARTWALLLSTR